MADDVLVEPDTNAGLLQPVPGQRFGQYGPLGGENPVGFTPERRQRHPGARRAGHRQPRHGELRRLAQQAERRRSATRRAPAAATAPRASTGRGSSCRSASTPKRTPVMGSYDENTVAAKATSAWYQLPPRTPDRPLVTVAAAGAIWYYEEDGSFNYGQSLKLQWGVHRPDGTLPGARRRSSRSTSSCKRLGATCVSRWPGRRRRPTSRASSPTTPTCPPISGSRSPRRGCRCWRPRSSSSGRRRRC